MARIVIPEFMDEDAVARLARDHAVFYDAALVDDPAELRRLVGDVDALIVRNRTLVRGDLLNAMPHCKIIGRLGVGLDNIDVDACAARGIAIIPATGANAQSVAEYVIAVTLLLMRGGAYASTADVVAGHWPRAALSNGREVGGRMLGLIGFGSIGQATARLARGIGMRVIAHDAAHGLDAGVYRDAGVESMPFDAVLSTADVLSIHVPLVASTRNLFDADRIAAMKRGAVLVNTARGGIVDEAAVAAALKSGHLGGAALDVFEVEPLGASNPFAGCPNLLLTPHIAGVTVESNVRVSMLVADNVAAALRTRKSAR
jgi:(S)-sulfolactate dehydrogenase